MITTYAAILTLSGIIFLKSETSMFDIIKTTVAESPIPKPFLRVVVTASVGHIPRSCTKVGFSNKSPFFSIEFFTSNDEVFILPGQILLNSDEVYRKTIGGKLPFVKILETITLKLDSIETI